MFHNIRRRRDIVTIGYLIAASTAVLSLSLSACSSDAGNAPTSLDDVKGSTVRIGVADTMPTSAASTTPTGLVPELTERVLKKLGAENVTAVPMEFGALIPSLQSGRIDVVAAGLYVTTERCNAITLADPSFYYLDGMAVVEGNPYDIKTYADIARTNVDLGALSGTATIGHAEAAGVDSPKIHEYGDVPSMLDALKAGRIDVASYDNVTTAWELSKPAYSDLSATEPTAPIVDGVPQPYPVSVGFAKDAEEIAQAFNETQAEMFQAGEFDALIEKWHLPKESTRPSDAPGIDEICSD